MPLGAFKAALMGVAGVSTGDVVLLSSQTADEDSELDFTGLMTATYGEYIFRFYNIHPQTDNVNFQFNLSIDSGSNYNVAKISTSFRAQHGEDDSSAVLNYDAAFDLPTGSSSAGVTNDQPIADTGNDADQNIAGELHLFNPASTTYVKHFYSQTNATRLNDLTQTYHIGGYGNTTSAVNAVSFKMSSGNFDGVIQMYGIA